MATKKKKMKKKSNKPSRKREASYWGHAIDFGFREISIR